MRKRLLIFGLAVIVFVVVLVPVVLRNANDRPIPTLTHPFQTVVVGAGYSPDGQNVIISYKGENECLTYWWNIAKERKVKEIDACTSAGWLFDPVTQSAEGNLLIMPTSSTVEILNPATGEVFRQFTIPDGVISSMAYSSDGRSVAVSTFNGQMMVWNTNDGHEVFQIMAHSDAINTVVYSPDGQFIVTASDDGTARIWDAASGQETIQLIGHENYVRSAAYSPDGLFVVTASRDMTARIWDATTGEEIKRLNDIYGQGINAMYSPDGNYVLTAAYFTDTVKIWDVSTWECVQSFSHTEPQHGHLQYATFSPDGRSILTVAGNVAKIWNNDFE